MYAIQGAQLSRRYGGFYALETVDIAIEQGEIRGLIGPNGAGKSTLIDVISGRATNWSGKVSLHGADISGLTVQQRHHAGLARSFQKTNIFPDLSVQDQLEIAAMKAEVPNVDEVMRELGLAALAKQRAADVSYGDRRRLDLALALIGRPKVLLLDEPAAGLSMSESLAMAELLKGLADRWKVTVLLVEHDMDVVFALADRITVLVYGRTIASGEPGAIRANIEVKRAYLGERYAAG